MAVGVSEHCGRRWFADAGGVKPRFADEQPRRRPRLIVKNARRSRWGWPSGVGAQHRRSAGPGPVDDLCGRSRTTASWYGRYRSRFRFGAPWRGGTRSGATRPAPRRPESSGGRAGPNPANLQLTRNCVRRCRPGLDQQHSAEQIDGTTAGWSSPTIRRCGCRPRPSTSRSTCKDVAELRRELHRCLRTGRAVRRPQRRADRRREHLPGMVMISERPADVADRAVPGHWEGRSDRRRRPAVRRSAPWWNAVTRFVMLLHLPDDHGALSGAERDRDQDGATAVAICDAR